MELGEWRKRGPSLMKAPPKKETLTLRECSGMGRDSGKVSEPHLSVLLGVGPFGQNKEFCDKT